MLLLVQSDKNDDLIGLLKLDTVYSIFNNFVLIQRQLLRMWLLRWWRFLSNSVLSQHDSKLE